ncbi:hypothetical protein PV327_004644 [Microctonus hyperodae]|uniref:Oligopeptide transporter 1 n=1 Tax=Microctonus hyperodae TaxID=165561 RepID=A0AA39KMR7_MICHY|nr:hypothetical protein PV327_004644 [Microctonus hyperodae]
METFVLAGSNTTAEVIEENEKKKAKYPKSIFFIVTNECCERFSYHGMRVLLALYFHNKLGYNDDISTIIYHVFTMLVAFFPLLGAVMADAWLGKFKTILYLSIVYAIGQILLSAAATPIFGLPIRELSMIGLALIALGTGGIKPCVAAFGGEQFILPLQEKYLKTFFSVLYFIINLGSLVSALLTPELRNGIQCFGDTTCDAVAFLFPAILMILSIVIFIMGRPMYKIKQPKGNVMFDTARCIYHAVYNKISSNSVTRNHWLDYADDKFDVKLIDDIKSLLRVSKLFLPLPIFWALYDQQGSRWTFQATRMNGEIGGYFIKPDQMQVINPLLILAFIPIFQTCIYPLLTKVRLIDTPLKKLTTGGFIAGIAFIVSGLVELQLEKTYPVLPSNGLAQLRIFNLRNCSIDVNLGNQNFTIDSYDMWQNTSIEAIGNKSIDYTIDSSKCRVDKKNGKIDVMENAAISYVFGNGDSIHSFKDRVNKTKGGHPALRILSYNILNDSKTIVKLIKNSVIEYTIEVTNSKSQLIQNSIFIEPNRGIYDVEVNGKIVKPISLKFGGVYTLQVYTSEISIETRLVTVTEPNSVHIFWLIPQYIIITIAEVMFAVTGLEFAFTQAPNSMKSLVQAGWLLTMATGNLIIIIIAKAKIFNSQANEFFLFAGLMFLNMIIFSIMTLYYKYIVVEDENDNEINCHTQHEISSQENCNGFVNPSFTEATSREGPKKVLKKLSKIFDKYSQIQLQNIEPRKILSCSIKVLYLCDEEFYKSNKFCELRRNKNYKLAKSYYHKLLNLYIPKQTTNIINIVIEIIHGEGFWQWEDLCEVLISGLINKGINGFNVVQYLLDKVEIEETNFHDARLIIRRLNMNIFENYPWPNTNETLIIIERLLNFFHQGINDTSDANGKKKFLTRSIEFSITKMSKNLSNDHCHYIIHQLCSWTVEETIEETKILEFTSILEYIATVQKTNLLANTLNDDLFIVVMQMIASSSAIVNILGNRVLQYLIDRGKNRSQFESPQIFFENTNYKINISKYNERDKEFLKQHREIFHDTFVEGFITHSAIRLNLECMYCTICLLAIEVPCGFTAAALVCLIMNIQDLTLNESNINHERANDIHTTIMAIMTLICWIHHARVLYSHVNEVMMQRAQWAPHLNPPYKAQYTPATHHIMWNKPEHFFVDWEVRFGLWKCFRLYAVRNNDDFKKVENTLKQIK